MGLASELSEMKLTMCFSTSTVFLLPTVTNLPVCFQGIDEASSKDKWVLVLLGHKSILSGSAGAYGLDFTGCFHNLWVAQG